MGGPQPRIGLNLKVAQKQILTPGLVQMVSVLALNKLELREMINQEMIANPVLEELSETVPTWKKLHRKRGREARRAAPPDQQSAPGRTTTPSRRSISARSSTTTWTRVTGRRRPRSSKSLPSRTSFRSRASLADHLEWQLSLSICSDAVREAAFHHREPE